MIRVLLLPFVLLSVAQANAEVLSIPEDCFSQQVEPCLIKAGSHQILKSQSGAFRLEAEKDSIFKITKFESPATFELLQGKIMLVAGGKTPLKSVLNDVQFESLRVFAEMMPERKMKVYDSHKFILSDYELPATKGEEAVLVKSEFLAKQDMIRYLSYYFSGKKALVTYLKTIESLWKKEFEAQTKVQTIALQRAIASIQKDEDEAKHRQEKEQRERKKVREMFFYRTFYR